MGVEWMAISSENKDFREAGGGYAAWIFLLLCCPCE